MAERNSRKELADFLKTRRTRLSPADFGLPPGARRRAAGLRREEVAALAGIGLTWYTWLEQGKEIQVSAAFLETLARGLKFTTAERAHLFALAQHRPPPFPPPAAAQTATGELQSILDIIDRPAYARNTCFDVMAWNGANTRMFGDFASIAPAERNVVWLMFARRYHRRAMPHWETDARNLLATFRLSFGASADQAPFLRLIAALDGVSADFRRLWAAHDVSDLGEGVTHFTSPRHGERRFQHYSMIPEAQPDLRLIVFIPATDL